MRVTNKVWEDLYDRQKADTALAFVCWGMG